jgi:hypothetical protein
VSGLSFQSEDGYRLRRDPMFTLRQKGGDFTEMGAGMITINANQVTASGKSVFFGATAPNEGISTFT